MMGEPFADRGMSRLGRFEFVGVTTAWEEGVRRRGSREEARGDAIVNMFPAYICSGVVDFNCWVASY